MRRYVHSQRKERRVATTVHIGKTMTTSELLLHRFVRKKLYLNVPTNIGIASGALSVATLVVVRMGSTFGLL